MSGRHWWLIIMLAGVSWSARTEAGAGAAQLAAKDAMAGSPAWDTFSDTWVATDALGRALPTSAQTPAPRKDRFVGIFYFLWLGEHSRGIYDNSKLLAENPADPKYGPAGAFHHWGQPLLGYYKSDDEGVIRIHMAMLADAGIDVLFLDVTNGPTYDKPLAALCNVLEERRALGEKFPKIAFITHSREVEIVTRLYERFYAKNLHRELWFEWLGRPLILAKGEGLKAEVKAFFTFRETWAWSRPKGWFGDGRDKWCWIDDFPQRAGWHEAAGKPEEISVKVAGHPTDNLGRSYHNGKEPPAELRAAEQGLCFAEQWKRALEVDPQIIFVTGWNEWVAQRFIKGDAGGAGKFLGRPVKKGDSFFVDQYNAEFSRDIEPMAGGFGDNYYYQLVVNARKFKGARAIEPVRPRPIAMDGKFDDWKEVAPDFRDDIGDPIKRDHEGFEKNGPRLVNQTGRNDLVAGKVSWDEGFVYFYMRTKDPITPPADANWMMLYLDIDANPATGWLGYDLVVNRSRVGMKARVEKNVRGKYEWAPAGEADYRVAGNEMEMAIPRGLLGKTLPAAIDFKWADNIQQTGDFSDFVLNGDVAPNGRFNWRGKMGVR